MPTRRPWIAALLVLVVAACGSSTPSPAPSAASTPTTAPVETPTETPSDATLTPVPGGASGEPEPPPIPNPSTTETEWGTILDAVPEDFPVYPGAEPADLPEGPNSGSWIAGADVDEVATWYRNTFEELGHTVENLSSPLEDGSRVLDSRSDLPECRVQTTFRPADGSTMIIVLYGAGCGPY